MHVLNTLLDAMASSRWIALAVFLWVGMVWFPILNRLATWMDRKRLICSQCERLRTLHLDITERQLRFAEQIGVTPDEVAGREMPIYTLWAKTLLDLEEHQRSRRCTSR
jgi:hypothetical protein